MRVACPVGRHTKPSRALRKQEEEHIGCSLAASAEKEAYAAYLRQGAERLENPLHVVYINTSLKTKADTHNIVPTITCTS